MNPTILLRAVSVAVVSVALAGTPESSFAQHGGHGGGFRSGGFGGHVGGGSHGGGGFGNFHGSGGFGSFHNTGFGGFRGRGGFGGFRGDRFFGGFRGYPGFFSGFDFGFGFWPYWGAYPSWYGYGPWWGSYAYYSPYDYLDYPYDTPRYRYPRHDRDSRCRPDYRHPDNGCNDSSPDTSKPNSENPPPKPSNTLGPERSPERNYVTTNFADYSPILLNAMTAPTPDVASDHLPANSATQQIPSGVRPRVRNAIDALRAMPPDARERQLNSGRYDNFSPEERELLNNASQLVQAE